MREVLDRVTMQIVVRDHYAMIAAPIQRDVDGIPKGARHVRIPTAIGTRNTVVRFALRLGSRRIA